MEVKFDEEGMRLPDGVHELLRKNEESYRNRPETKQLLDLFEERPIWSKHALAERSGISKDILKDILPYIDAVFYVYRFSVHDSGQGLNVFHIIFRSS